MFVPEGYSMCEQVSLTRLPNFEVRVDSLASNGLWTCVCSTRECDIALNLYHISLLECNFYHPKLDSFYLANVECICCHLKVDVSCLPKLEYIFCHPKFYVSYLPKVKCIFFEIQIWNIVCSCLLSSENEGPKMLYCQLCSTCYTAVWIDNCLKRASSIRSSHYKNCGGFSIMIGSHHVPSNIFCCEERWMGDKEGDW